MSELFYYFEKLGLEGTSMEQLVSYSGLNKKREVTGSNPVRAQKSFFSFFQST